MLCEGFFDGLCEPVNPGGVATYGFAVVCNGVVVYRGCGVIGAGMFGDDVTNNVAEYTALIKLLEKALELNIDEFVAKGDSQLVIRQLTGVYRVRSPRIAHLYTRVKELEKMFRRIEYVWIPRKLNEEADNLSRKAYREFVERNRERFTEFYRRWLATEKQIELLKKLGITIEHPISRRESGLLIGKALKEGKKIENKNNSSP